VLYSWLVGNLSSQCALLLTSWLMCFNPDFMGSLPNLILRCLTQVLVLTGLSCPNVFYTAKSWDLILNYCWFVLMSSSNESAVCAFYLRYERFPSGYPWSLPFNLTEPKSWLDWLYFQNLTCLADRVQCVLDAPLPEVSALHSLLPTSLQVCCGKFMKC
jgi:hypothetical protein